MEKSQYSTGHERIKSLHGFLFDRRAGKSNATI